MGVGERCAGCGKPVGMQWATAEGRVWHEQCLTCDLCRSPLGNPYTMSDTWNWRVCHRHGPLMSCDCCGRAIPGTQNNPAVLERCDICRRAAVERERDASAHFHSCVGWLKKQGLKGDGETPLKLHLVDASWLHQHGGGQTFGQMLGIARHTILDYGGGRRTITHEGIAVLRGLPDPHFQSVVIHELGHAWLTIRGVHGLPQRDEEGFCQMLAYRYLQRSPHAAAPGFAKLLAETRDPIYGDGFRAVQALVDQVGFDRVISSLADDGRFPAGKSRWWGR